MVRFGCCVLAFLTIALFSVHGASLGKRTKRETCGVMMIRTNNCSNHGYCREDNIGPHCMCYEGWGGYLCQDAINTPQGERSPLVDDGGNNDSDNEDDDDVVQVTEVTRRPEVTTQAMNEETTVDQDSDGDDDDDDDEVMRTERPNSTQDGGAIGGDGGMSEGERIAFLCDELYAGTNTCSDRQGHCSVDGIGAFCQCNIGFIGVACQYRAENVAQVLQALIAMMRDPHYRVIGGFTP
ncbi:uncharacterized protein LOC121418016 [Lytechinus variegatus]|uniref:uncharacterized protein LOC121418016 n=1 Tax=Lytechinus variegatus TaxID=7654 RepID=UPI001BB1F78A|nr:uncharacterized protein LOC121418016 [Lytechinus variegatus]